MGNENCSWRVGSRRHGDTIVFDTLYIYVHSGSALQWPLALSIVAVGLKWQEHG